MQNVSFWINSQQILLTAECDQNFKLYTLQNPSSAVMGLSLGPTSPLTKRFFFYKGKKWNIMPNQHLKDCTLWNHPQDTFENMQGSTYQALVIARFHPELRVTLSMWQNQRSKFKQVKYKKMTMGVTGSTEDRDG